jgi:hypothetical protein
MKKPLKKKQDPPVLQIRDSGTLVPYQDTCLQQVNGCFRQDVIHCEVLTGGNPALLDQEPFAERRDSRIDYSKIFGDQSAHPVSGSTPAKRARPASVSAKKSKANVTPVKQEAKASGTPAKAGGGAIKTPKSGKKSGEQKTPKAAAVKKESAKKTNSPAVRTAVLSPSVARPAGSQKLSNDHKVRILAAPATPYHIDRTPQQGGGGDGRSDGADKKSAGGYTCHTCGFTATRLNVIVLHSKTHSAPPASNNSRSNFAAATATPPKSSPGGAKKPEKERPFRDDRVTSTSKPRKRDKGAAAAASKAERNAKGATAAGGPAVKKGRLTKKQREEKREQEERREAERRRLLGDWSEDEHQEEEEYKKLQVSCSLPLIFSCLVYWCSLSRTTQYCGFRDAYPGSEFYSIPDPRVNSKRFPDPGFASAVIRIIEFLYFNQKNCF